MTVKYTVDTDKGARVANCSWRPVTKKYLMFLKYLGLHMHSLNDGSAMGWDGRRQCNGIFDINYHVLYGASAHIAFPISCILILYLHHRIIAYEKKDEGMECG